MMRSSISEICLPQSSPQSSHWWASVVTTAVVAPICRSRVYLQQNASITTTLPLSISCCHNCNNHLTVSAGFESDVSLWSVVSNSNLSVGSSPVYVSALFEHWWDQPEMCNETQSCIRASFLFPYCPLQALLYRKYLIPYRLNGAYSCHESRASHLHCTVHRCPVANECVSASLTVVMQG